MKRNEYIRTKDMMQRACVFAFFIIGILPSVAFAQSDEGEAGRGWYVGTQGSTLMGTSDFSSFAVEKFYPGWNAGIFGGYHCNTVLSVEAFAQWGKAFLAERSCCAERNYWLNTEEWRRSVLTKGPGAYYNDLLSENFIKRYGVQFNINLLGFFHPNRPGRLRIEVAPTLSAVGSSTDLTFKKNGELFWGNIDKWHMGIGSKAQVSYAITRNLDLGLYGGISFLTGKNFDAMPVMHSDNYLYDAGIRLTWNFKKTPKAKGLSVLPVQERSVVESAESIVEQTVTESASPTVSEPVADTVMTVVEPSADEAREVSESIVENTTPELVGKTEDDTVSSPLNEQLSQNVIFFSFNSVWIEPTERDKVKEIANLMKAHPSVRVRVTGWGDSKGTEQQNQRVSLQRAQAVKRVLGQWLIPAERIEVAGGGIKSDAPTDAQARCAITIEIVE